MHTTHTHTWNPIRDTHPLNPIKGMSEYAFFLLAALGLFILRRRRREVSSPHTRPSTYTYRTRTCNPVIFCLFSTLILVRGVVTDPSQGLAVFFLTLIGWAVFKRRFM